MNFIASPAGNSNKVTLIIDPEEGEIIDDDHYTGDILIQRNGETPISLFGAYNDFNQRTTALENKHLYVHNIELSYTSVGVSQQKLICRFTLFTKTSTILNYDNIVSLMSTLNKIPASGWYGNYQTSNWSVLYGISYKFNKLYVEGRDNNDPLSMELPFSGSSVNDAVTMIY